MFLSIIIPVYNCEKYLKDCLDSCFEQDIDSSDYEVICINDGSTDNSISILREYEKIFSNLVVIDQPNSGQPEATKNGRLVAKGDYLWFVDSDDIIHKNCLHMLKNLSFNNYDIISFVGFVFNENLSRNEIKIDDKYGRIKKYSGHKPFHLFKAYLFKSSDYDYYPEIKYGEDEMLFLVLNEIAETEFRLNQVLYFYRQRTDSMMNQLKYSIKARRKRMEDILSSMIILRDKILAGKYTKEFSYTLMRSRYDLSIKVLAQFKKKDAEQYFQMMRNEGLFNENLILILASPNEDEFKKSYLHLHHIERKRIIRSTFSYNASRVLPERMIGIIKGHIY